MTILFYLLGGVHALPQLDVDPSFKIINCPRRTFLRIDGKLLASIPINKIDSPSSITYFI